MGDLSNNFSRHEFACKDNCGFDTIDFETLIVLEDVRDNFGSPITITGPNRCWQHNIDEGGAEDSQHLYARAVDFVVAGVAAQDVQSYLKMRYPNMYGIGVYSNRTHLDTRSNGPARW